MTVSFKDKIAVVGVGCTRFAENFDLSYSDMLAEACFQAFEEARVEPKEYRGCLALHSLCRCQCHEGSFPEWTWLKRWVSSTFPSPGFPISAPQEGMPFAKPAWPFSPEPMISSWRWAQKSYGTDLPRRASSR